MTKYLSLLLAVCPLVSAAELGEPLVYKKAGDRELRLFAVKPPDWKAADRRPAIVFFHGGGWVGGSPGQFAPQGSALAAKGLVVLHAEYRFLTKGAPKQPPVICIQDANSALRWTRSHAAELGVDPQRIGAAGGSAGGHLAAFTGLAEGVDDPADDTKVSPKANALLLFNPVLDNGPEGGWGRERTGDGYKKYSPAHHVSKDDPPAIVFLGREDPLIPVAVIERFAARMKEAGVKCETHFYEGQAHGFFNRDPYQKQTLDECMKFLRGLGWMP